MRKILCGYPLLSVAMLVDNTLLRFSSVLYKGGAFVTFFSLPAPQAPFAKRIWDLH